jgi:hypothetical protein
MTTETPKAADETPKTQARAQPKGPPEKDDEQSLLPTVLAGAGILIVAALLIFWPSGDDAGKDREGKAAAAAAGGRSGEGGEGGPSGRPAGVGARQIDAATTPEGRGTRNPAIKLPTGGNGMAPVPEALPKDPPADAPVADKIAFYEKRLEQAVLLRDSRKKFFDRLPQVQAKVESSKNPEEGMKAFEKRKQIVEDNYAKAQADVEDIEKKLAELRGG